MRSSLIRLVCGAAIAFGVIACNDTKSTGPKETLTEQEKQQIKDLNKQRSEEWGSTKSGKR